ncbi:hypothetical protein MF069_36515 [Paenibacillus mucilaginosus]|nr:hypothetical protein [Paenibacillus mucilaginosus]MCG7218205.1 hypothetical protein [Paenibacillus mucilaginosus]
MYTPVTVSELASFVNSIAFAFSDTLMIGFSIMMAFAVAYGIRNLFLG